METDRLTALIADLDHPDKPTIRAAVDQLIGLARESVQVRTALEQRLVELGHRDYWPVAYVLGHLPQPSGATIRNLLDTLDHREPDIRWAIVLLLVRIAKTESSIINLLIELCENGTTNQKRMAIYGLRDLVLNDVVSLQALLSSLSDPDPTVRVAAATSLKNRTDDAERVRSALLQSYLLDVDIKVRSAAAVTLANIGLPSEEFLRALKEASESDNSQSKKAATVALALLEKREPASIAGMRQR
jgi:HEAT repeat protein